MIHTIQVDRVLHETVRLPYRDLVTRPTGVAVRNRIERLLADADCSTARLDFSAVGLIDFSCADEVVAKLILAVGRESGCYLLLQGLGEHQAEAIDQVLERRSLAVAATQSTGEPLLLGRADEDVRAAFGQLYARGRSGAEAGAGGDDDGAGAGDGASDLASALEWSVERATEALMALSLLRLVIADGSHYRPLPFPQHS